MFGWLMESCAVLLMIDCCTDVHLSISHDGEYAIATSCLLSKGDLEKIDRQSS